MLINWNLERHGLAEVSSEERVLSPLLISIQARALAVLQLHGTLGVSSEETVTSPSLVSPQAIDLVLFWLRG